MQRMIMCMALLAGVAVAPVSAQIQDDEAALERGRAVIAMWWDGDAEALWETMTPGFQAQLGSIDPLMESRDELIEGFGMEAVVVEEALRPVGDNVAYWRIVELEAGPELFIFHLIIQPDGLIALGRGGFESEVGRPPEE